MASSTTKAGPSTAASTNMLQPTNAAQASGLASLITATAAPAFTALGSPHASSPLSGAQTALRLQADGKVSSEIDKLVESGKTATAAASASAATPMRSISELKAKIQSLTSLEKRPEVDLLVEFGKTSGITFSSGITFNKAEIRLLIADKIRTLREIANKTLREIADKTLCESEIDVSDLTSARSDLCNLSRISSKHYPALKEDIYNLLIFLMENDPILQCTAEGVLEVVIDLNNDLAVKNDLAVLGSEALSIKFQQKLVRTFSTAVELYLRHYSVHTVNAVTEAQKTALLDATGSFRELNSQEDVDIKYATAMAEQASRRFTSTLTAYREFFNRFIHGVTAMVNASNKDASGFISEIVLAFKGLEHKFKEKWFEAIFLLRREVQKAPNTTMKVTIIQTILDAKQTSYDWEFIYGALEILEDVISRTDNVRVLEFALFGQPVEQTTTSAAQPKVIKLPGTIKFCNFRGYTKKAKAFATEDDKKADEAIRQKAHKLSVEIRTKLKATEDGRHILSCRKSMAINQNKKTVKEFLSDIPSDLKEQKKWVGPLSISNKRIVPARANVSSMDNASTTAAKIDNVTLFKPKHDERDNKMLSVTVVPTADTASTPCVILTTSPSSKNETDEKHTSALRDKKVDSSRYAIADTGTASKTVQTISLIAAVVRKTDPEQNLQNNEIEVKTQSASLTINPIAISSTDSAFFQAVIDGNIAYVQTIIKQNKKLVNATDSQRNTPLILAARYGHLEICKMLLNAKAIPITRGEIARDALHNAAAAGHTEIVKLFANEQDLKETDQEGNTPLLLAAKGGHSEVCSYLLEKFPSCAAQRGPLPNEYTALHLAVLSENFTIVEQVVNQSPKLLKMATTQDQATALMLAAARDLTAICDKLLRAGSDPCLVDKDGSNVMHHAARSGKSDCIRVLALNNQVKLQLNLLVKSPNKLGLTPLLIAVREGHRESYEALLKVGATSDEVDTITGCNVMHFAAQGGHEALVSYLAASKATMKLVNSKNYNGVTPLMLASERGHQRICTELVEAADKAGKANKAGILDEMLQATDNDGRNAVHYAADSGRSEIISDFGLRQKVENLINAPSKTGETPLMLAAAKGHEKACAAFVEEYTKARRLDELLLAKNHSGINAMHFAAWNGKAEIIRYFAACGGKIRLIDSTSKSGQTPLMLAAAQGHQEACRMLLHVGADLHTIDLKGRNALHYAAAQGHQEACQVLLKGGADLQTLDLNGRNALHLAARNGQSVIVKIFAERDTTKELVKSDNKKDGGKTALHYAAEKGSKVVVEELIKQMKNISTYAAALNEVKNLFGTQTQPIDSKTSDGKTALMIAAELGHHDICKVLLEADADCNTSDQTGWNALHLAVLKEQTEIIKMLLRIPKLIDSELFDSVTDAGDTPLSLALQHSTLTIYDMLKQAGANLNSALLNSAARGHRQTCEALLKYGADPHAVNDKGWNALHLAAYYGKWPVFVPLLKCNDLINSKAKDGKTPLILAAERGHPKTCEELIKAIPNSTLADNVGWNAMHFATLKQKTAVIEIFIKHKLLIDSKTKEGRTPLMIAANKGFTEICRLLLSKSEIFVTDNAGWNVMHYAAYFEKPEIVEMLLTYKQLLDSTTKSGYTPLMLAAEQGHLEVCKLLLNSGNVTNADGQNAIKSAEATGKEEVVKLLSEHMKQLASKK